MNEITIESWRQEAQNMYTHEYVYKYAGAHTCATQEISSEFRAPSLPLEFVWSHCFFSAAASIAVVIERFLSYSLSFAIFISSLRRITAPIMGSFTRIIFYFKEKLWNLDNSLSDYFIFHNAIRGRSCSTDRARIFTCTTILPPEIKSTCICTIQRVMQAHWLALTCGVFNKRNDCTSQPLKVSSANSNNR